jgi:hypothetical protein
MGLFYTDVLLKVSDSIMTGNTVNYFLHTGSDGSLELRNCHLESFTFEITGAGDFATVDCLTDGTELEAVPTCVTQTMTYATQSPIQTEFPTATFTVALQKGYRLMRGRVIFQSGWFLFTDWMGW